MMSAATAADSTVRRIRGSSQCQRPRISRLDGRDEGVIGWPCADRFPRDDLTDPMPAAVYTGDGAIAVQELALPGPGPDEVLVEVSHCGICGTDLHLVLEQYARPGSVLGHEWAGTVAALG